MKAPVTIKSQKELVEELLRRSKYLRDHDEALVASCILRIIGEDKITRMSAVDLLVLMEEGELPHFESIRRTRQKLQEHNPELRGRKYIERKGVMEEAIREETRNW